MKILFMMHPQYTSCTHYLYEGLCRLIGPENVIECPYNPMYHGQDTNLDEIEFYKRVEFDLANGWHGYGIPPFSPWETLTTENQRFIPYNPSVMPQPVQPSDEYRPDVIVHRLRDGYYDLIVLGDSNRVSTIVLSWLRENAPLPPVIYLDAGERDELNEHWIHVYRPSLVFKQILTPDVLAKGCSVAPPNYTLRLYPLPLCSPIVDRPKHYIGPWDLQTVRVNDITKWIDGLFYLGPTWDDRARISETLTPTIHRHPRLIGEQLTYSDYIMALAKSRISVTMRGSGRDTTRYWEIPMFETAMICDGTMGCIHPFPFRDKETAIFYRSMEELIHVTDYYLDPDHVREREIIASSGKHHLTQFHTTRARAVFFLERVDEHMGLIDNETRIIINTFKTEQGWQDKIETTGEYRDKDWHGPVV